jgi:UDP-N-acetylbacillosamine N-acetyltransferase
MSNRSIVIYGAGPLAKLMQYYFEEDSSTKVVAFSVDPAYQSERMFCRRPVVPFDQLTTEYPPSEVGLFVAIGYRNMRNRILMFNRACALGYELVNYVSSRAITYSDLSIGKNNALMANVHVEPFTLIGHNNLFFSDTLIAHNVTIGNGNVLAARVLIGGNSKVQNSCFFGNGTILINEVAIADETHTFPGTVIVQDTKACTKYLGNPARQIGTHEETGIIIERG